MTQKKKTGTPQQHRYTIDRSPLFGLSSKKRLSELLGVELRLIRDVEKAGLTRQYKIFVDRKSRRFICQPVDELEKIHRRLLKYLIRIAPPSYVHSAIKSRSYRSNANAHLLNGPVLKIDIKKFFPSIKYDRIHSFFFDTFKCAPDIATILAKLCVVCSKNHGVHIPTGSCLSPAISYLANIKMFDRIAEICAKAGCRFTLYVDDITISGAKANHQLLGEVASVIFQRGYKYHKTNVQQSGHALITGLVVTPQGLRLPFKRVKKIRDLSETLFAASVLNLAQARKREILASLVGCLSEAEQIESRYKLIRARIVEEHCDTWNEIVKNRTKRAALKRQQATRAVIPPAMKNCTSK
ncbi:reverse transcriptase family protein [Chitinolyticbacter meiyuanensis]|uniref:reverse transcriptase family protein n=1 Tax=Chitinolyticbacter meiyuanensis TaxID=682798 RepID=UPI0011E5F771|nr:reverse transcriptase family protein [Chitinolyticbacter meiyuanensis]